MLLALVNLRARSLAIFVAAGAFGGGLLWVAWGAASSSWALSQRGHAAQAVVLRGGLRHGYTSGRIKTATKHVVTVEYDGHRATIEASGRRGDRVSVLYDPDDPQTVTRGAPGDGFFDLLDRLQGIWVFLGMVVGGLGISMYALYCFASFLEGTDPAQLGDEGRDDEGRDDEEPVQLV
jgi:hypothetical protein